MPLDIKGLKPHIYRDRNWRIRKITCTPVGHCRNQAPLHESTAS